MSKKAIDLLEKVVEALYQKVEGFCPWCGAKDYPVCGDKQGYEKVKAEDAEEWHIDHCEDCIVVYLDQALAILKKPKCDTCDDSGRIPTFDQASQTADAEPCPDCQKPKDQQPSSEFTKRFRISLNTQDKTVVVQDAYGACDRLDRTTQQRNDLLEVCKRVRGLGCLRDEESPKCREGDMCCICAVKAVIAKAEKEG